MRKAAFIAAVLWASPAAALDFKTAAETLLNGYVAAGRFSGAVLVARDGAPILRGGFGLANREWDIPVTPETVFRLGSITKQFTATAILQLAEQGKLRLDDKASTYYTAAPPAWSAITIAHLLSHRSGIPSYTAIPRYFDGPARLDTTPEQLIALTRDKPLEFTPGSKFAYDNSGYILLGYVIEKVSGQSYAAYVRDHIFMPLGMTHTGYEDSSAILPHRAAGYAKGKAGWENAAYLSMTVPYAAGSLYSTVDDLLLWDQALYAAKPLRQGSLEVMFTDHGDHYGTGYVIETQEGRRVWWHNGGINGFSTFLARYPDQRLTVIVLSNYENAPATQIGVQLARLSFGEPADPAAKQGEHAHEGTEAALRHVIGELQTGNVDFSEISDRLAALMRPHVAQTQALLAAAGALHSVSFTGSTDKGADTYLVKFAQLDMEFQIRLGADGKIVLLRLTPK